MTIESRAKKPEKYKTLYAVYTKEWRKKNRQKVESARLQRLYGIGLEEYGALLEAQGGLCAICKKESKLHVDRCHDSGSIRGLLCASCNVGIGFFRNDPLTLGAAASYLCAE